MTASDFDKTGSEELRKLLAFSKRKTYEFWLKNVQLITPKGTSIGEDGQRHFVARFMTRFSLVSTSNSMFWFPTFTNLAQIYDEFIMDVENQYSPEPMEVAGCQILLLGGFYLKAAEKHYNLADIEKLGKLCFARGAIGKRAGVIKKMAYNFGKWQDALCYLEWYLRNERLVVQNIEKPDEPLIRIVPR